MKMTQVESSNIKAIGYNEDDGTLAVEFKRTNSIYHYYNVPEHVVNQLLHAHSIGKAFNDLIKLGGYEYEQVV